MVVACPKCKVKLNVPDEKIAPEGTRFKCPKCTVVLLVKKPAPKARELDKNKIIIALVDAGLAQEMASLLVTEGFDVMTSGDGVDAMVKAQKILPGVAILDVALPKIYGFEVCKRLKSSAELKDLKVILYTSVHDKDKYRREPASLYGADEYLENFEVESRLIPMVKALIHGALPESTDAPMPGTPQKQTPSPTPSAPKQPDAAPGHETTTVGGAPAGDNEWTIKAKRLARTVLSDIFLYNPQKAVDALRGGTFRETFVTEINEGRKLYESRIPQETRDQMNYFEAEVTEFLEGKKKSLNI